MQQLHHLLKGCNMHESTLCGAALLGEKDYRDKIEYNFKVE